MQNNFFYYKIKFVVKEITKKIFIKYIVFFNL